MATAAERVAAALKEVSGEVEPRGIVGSRALADHYGIKVARVTTNAKRGVIPSAYKREGRWLFDFEVAIAGWKPAELIRSEQDPRGVRGYSGRFGKGNTYGVGKTTAGRPPREREKRYMAILNSEVIRVFCAYSFSTILISLTCPN